LTFIENFPALKDRDLAYAKLVALYCRHRGFTGSVATETDLTPPEEAVEQRKKELTPRIFSGKRR
jgi:hypothetical protein